MTYIKEALLHTLKQKTIPSLDGLRAISVLFVVLGHVFQLKFDGGESKFFIYQDLGVSLFFVISGYLITEILIQELRKTGSIHFKTFFLKRVFRIFPAYYFFLIVSLLIFPSLGIQADFPSILSCFLYLGDYYPPKILSYWAHSWSLAIEEQFYLLWPTAINILKKESSIKKFLLSLIIIAPILRVVTYFFIPIYKHKYPFLLHTRIDTLAFGSLYAFYQHQKSFDHIKTFCLKKSSFLLSTIFLLGIYPLLHHYFLGKYRATVGYTIEGALLLVIIIHTTLAPKNWYINILNSRALTHIGSISYGIYLWQQPFTYIRNDLFLFQFPVNLVFIYLFALISHFFVEYPMMKLRKKFI